MRYLYSFVVGSIAISLVVGLIYLLGCVSLLVSNEVVLAGLKGMGY